MHLAVRYGRVAITELLLEQGANVNARDVSGNGIIAVGMEHNKKSNAKTLSAQISLCIDLIIKAGGVAAPTFDQEWHYHGERMQKKWPWWPSNPGIFVSVEKKDLNKWMERSQSLARFKKLQDTYHDNIDNGFHWDDDDDIELEKDRKFSHSPFF